MWRSVLHHRARRGGHGRWSGVANPKRRRFKDVRFNGNGTRSQLHHRVLARVAILFQLCAILGIRLRPVLFKKACREPLVSRLLQRFCENSTALIRGYSHSQQTPTSRRCSDIPRWTDSLLVLVVTLGEALWTRWKLAESLLPWIHLRSLVLKRKMLWESLVAKRIVVVCLAVHSV